MTSTEYDQFQYTSHPFDHSAPVHLAGIGRLYGLQPPALENSRVLELGCASGGNLIPHAISHPGGYYVGVDLSAVQIAEGQRLVDSLGLENVKLLATSISDLEEDLGRFDYIIAHGLYSWIPIELQATVTAVIDRHLADNGLAYVSYNTYPGWYLINPVRDAMLYMTRDQSIESKAATSRAFLENWTRAMEGNRSPYAQLIRDEHAMLQGKEDYYLVHEHLNGNNNPVYFSDFMATAGDNHLQYVADSEMRNSLIDDLQPALRETIEQQQAPVDREQLIDFFTNRRFRKSILCRSSQTVSEAPDINAIEALFFLGQIASHDPFSDQSMAESVAMQFKTYEGVSVTVNHPALKLLLRLFILKPGVPLSLNEIRQELEPAGLDFNNPAVRDFMNQSLLTLVMRSFLRVTPCGPWFNQLNPEQPKASALVRHQAGLSNLVTNLRHQNVSLPDFERVLIGYMDGTRSLADIVNELKTRGFAELPADHPARSFADRDIPELMTTAANCLVQFRNNALIH